MWLCILSSRSFEETHENAQWRKVKQMQPMWLCIFSGRQFEDTHAIQKSRKLPVFCFQKSWYRYLGPIPVYRYTTGACCCGVECSFWTNYFAKCTLNSVSHSYKTVLTTCFGFNPWKEDFPFSNKFCWNWPTHCFFGQQVFLRVKNAKISTIFFR